MKISLMLVVFATFIYELFMISLICVYIYIYMIICIIFSLFTRNCLGGFLIHLFEVVWQFMVCSTSMFPCGLFGNKHFQKNLL